MPQLSVSKIAQIVLNELASFRVSTKKDSPDGEPLKTTSLISSSGLNETLQRDEIVLEDHDKMSVISCVLAVTRNKPAYTFWQVDVVDDALLIGCGICGRDATERHYDVNCCDECKGPLYHTIKERSVPDASNRSWSLCSFLGPCDSCPPCRLRICAEAAIDKMIRKRQMAPRVDQLSASKCISSSVLKEEARKVFIQTDHARLELFRRASKKEVTSAHHLSDAFGRFLKRFVRCIRSFRMMREFSNSDRTTLVKANAPRHFIFEILRRSQRLQNEYVFDLGSNFIFDGAIWTSSDEPQICEFFGSLVPLLIQVKKLQITNEEFAYLRAFAFFDPRIPDLQDKKRVEMLWVFFWNQLEIMEVCLVDFQRDRFKKLMAIAKPVRDAADRLLGLLKESDSLGGALLQEFVLPKHERN